MSRSGETRLGLADSQSDQTHPLECTVHYDDDNVEECDGGNGHPLKNSPKDVREEFLVGGMTVRSDPLESLKRDSPAAKMLELLPLCVWHMMMMIALIIVLMAMVIFKRIPEETAQKRGPRWEGCSSVLRLWRGLQEPL